MKIRIGSAQQGRCDLEVDPGKDLVVAVTGHRPQKLGGFGDAAWERQFGFAVKMLELIEPRIVLTGMALGWDQAVAAACVWAKIPFEAAIPCQSQDSVWPKESRDFYAWLLKDAAKIHQVSDEFYSPRLMQRRNEFMVDRCEALLALWDGTNGGTANCVRYAVRQSRDVWNVWPEWLEKQSAPSQTG